MVGDSGPSEPSERSPHTVGTSDSACCKPGSDMDRSPSGLG